MRNRLRICLVALLIYLCGVVIASADEGDVFVTYRIDREYWINGELVKFVPGTEREGALGDLIIGSQLDVDNSGWLIYRIEGEKRTFDYAGSYPDVMRLSNDDDNVITLMYEINDVVRKSYTIVYKDGCSGNAFGDESHGNLVEGDLAPQFGQVLGVNSLIETCDSVGFWVQTYGSISDIIETFGTDEYRCVLCDETFFGDSCYEDAMLHKARHYCARCAGYHPTVMHSDMGYRVIYKFCSEHNVYHMTTSGVAYVSEDTVQKHNSTFALGEKVPSRTGYTFSGWTPTFKDKVISAMANDDGEIIYTATWRKNDAKLQVTKTTDKEQAKPGDIVTFTIAVTNISDVTAHDVYIIDVLPDYLEFESYAYYGGSTYKVEPPDSVYEYGYISANDTVILRITCRVSDDAPEGLVTNRVVVKYRLR